MDLKKFSKKEIFEMLELIQLLLVCKDEKEMRQVLERTNPGTKEHFASRHKLILDYIARHFHQVLLGVNKGSRGKDIPQLTDREKEVLHWMKEGKSYWDISMILDISERTVKFHIQNIRCKLGAVNNVQAVAVAMDLELIA